VRRLRYRLKRQGMLELDEWLAPLEVVLEAAQPEAVAAIAGLLGREPVDLLDVMRGKRMPPACLQDVLAAGSALKAVAEPFPRKTITKSGLGAPKRCINRP
jgi:antitoxin CptB